MPAEDTVATLNQIGGKSSAAGTKFRARVSDIWSPQKKTQSSLKETNSQRRSSGRLKPKRLSEAGLSANRRNSLSLPTDDDNEDQTPAPKPKKRATLKKKANKDAGRSPLKNHGYNIELAESSKVNLADSPAKNTRSKNDKPFATLLKANIPLPESLIRPDQVKVSAGRQLRRKTLNSTNGRAVTSHKRKRDGSTDDIPEKVSVTRITDHADNDRDNEHVDGSINGQVNGDKPGETAMQSDKGEGSRHNQDYEVEQEQEQNDREPSPPRNPRGHPPKKNTSRGDKWDENRKDDMKGTSDEERKLRGEQNPQAKSTEQHPVVRQKSNESELAPEEEAEFLKRQAQYAQFIETAIQISGCEGFWKRAGGAALDITTKAPPKPKSARGRAAMRRVLVLQGLYKELWTKDQESSQRNRKIAKQLKEVDRRCELLTQTGDRSRDDSTIKDMYHFVIPALMNLIKAFFRGRCRTRCLSESVLRELFQLVEITIDVCVEARAWDPQPYTLESGIKRMVKNDILANLKRIKKRYQLDIDHYNWVEIDRTRIQKLAEKQAMAREAQAQKIALIKMKRQQQRHRSNGHEPKQRQAFKISNGTRKEEPHDIDEIIDDIENDSPVQHSMEDTEEAPKGGTRPSLQFRRESTADLPPPLSVNLSEEEKMALLNGLQMYTGNDRYNEILNDHRLGAILGNRDLDDLVQAARSFSQMMASKLGVEKYQNDSAFSWLRSVDPDMQGRASVEL